MKLTARKGVTIDHQYLQRRHDRKSKVGGESEQGYGEQNSMSRGQTPSRGRLSTTEVGFRQKATFEDSNRVDHLLKRVSSGWTKKRCESLARSKAKERQGIYCSDYADES